MTRIKANLPAWSSLTDLFDEKWMKPKFFNGDWLPAVNVVENEDNYEIELAAPGFKKKDFKILIENGALIISGETEKEAVEEKKNFTRKEFSSKAFKKSFTLPENVVEEDIVANYEDGVLKLMLKKNKKALLPKKEIAIK